MKPRSWDDNIPPKDNPIVERIMRERGVGKRRAYRLWKERQAQAIDISDVGSSQRMAVMAALINVEGANGSVGALVDTLHHEGVRIDAHDATKTLWALQKQRWVTFRERANGDLYGIRVRPEGYEGYRAQYQNGKAVVETVEAVIEPEVIEPVEPDPLIDKARAIFADIEEERRLLPIDFTRYPLIHRLRERAEKAEKLNTAARILEDAGETDIALAVLEKAGMSPLEGEVVALLKEVFE